MQLRPTRLLAILGQISFAKSASNPQFFDMSTVQEIKSAIALLSLEERAMLIGDLCGRVDDDWDRQMIADATAGKFTALNEDAGHAYHTGQTKPLDEILRPS